MVLFVDGHKSHLSLELADFCSQNQIILYCLPPNSTHIMQPCDVAIFKPLKASWKNVVAKNKRFGNSINKNNFVNHFQEAFDSVQTSSIVNGFRKCGLYPFDPNAVDFSKCISYRRDILFPITNNDASLQITIQATSEEYKAALKVLGKPKLKYLKKKCKTLFLKLKLCLLCLIFVLILKQILNILTLKICWLKLHIIIVMISCMNVIWMFWSIITLSWVTIFQ